MNAALVVVLAFAAVCSGTVVYQQQPYVQQYTTGYTGYPVVGQSVYKYQPTVYQQYPSVSAYQYTAPVAAKVQTVAGQYYTAPVAAYSGYTYPQYAYAASPVVVAK